MGRQINFYFVQDDEREFLEQLNKNEISFLRRYVKNAENEIYEEFDINPGDKQLIAQTYICFDTDLGMVKYLEMQSGDYLIDSNDSPVIEYERSGQTADEHLIISGRLWYEHKYWTKDEDGNDVLMEKSKELEKLYNKLARWIRRYCTRRPSGMYIGPHAQKMHEQGAELSQG